MTAEQARLAYLSALSRAKQALNRELDVVQIGQDSLPSFSDALCAMRAARQAYCANYHQLGE